MLAMVSRGERPARGVVDDRRLERDGRDRTVQVERESAYQGFFAAVSVTASSPGFATSSKLALETLFTMT